tara:strand:+ start:2079 stop:2768 length:690 start_codon:yes stop_codon:yes gene_type:complete
MFDVIIPLRAGSKGIKNKNITLFNGEMLVNFLIKKILKIKNINKIYILTDSEKYKKKILKHQRVDTSYIRSKKLSEDNSSIYELIDDFLKFIQKKNILVNKILMFQVTSPLLKIIEIKKTLSFIIDKKLSSLFHVTKMIEHPEDCIKGLKSNWRPLSKKRVVNRQNYNQNYYFITGSLFYFTKKFFQKYKVTYNKSSFAYRVDKINFIDIDSKFDLEVAKKILNLKIRN